MSAGIERKEWLPFCPIKTNCIHKCSTSECKILNGLVEGNKETPEAKTDNPRGNRTRPICKGAKDFVKVSSLLRSNGYKDDALINVIEDYFKNLDGSKDQEELCCVHPYHMVYRKADFEKCNQCGKILYEG